MVLLSGRVVAVNYAGLALSLAVAVIAWTAPHIAYARTTLWQPDFGVLILMAVNLFHHPQNKNVIVYLMMLSPVITFSSLQLFAKHTRKLSTLASWACLGFCPERPDGSLPESYYYSPEWLTMVATVVPIMMIFPAIVQLGVSYAHFVNAKEEKDELEKQQYRRWVASLVQVGVQLTMAIICPTSIPIILCNTALAAFYAYLAYKSLNRWTDFVTEGLRALRELPSHVETFGRRVKSACDSVQKAALLCLENPYYTLLPIAAIGGFTLGSTQAVNTVLTSNHEYFLLVLLLVTCEVQIPWPLFAVPVNLLLVIAQIEMNHKTYLTADQTARALLASVVALGVFYLLLFVTTYYDIRTEAIRKRNSQNKGWWAWFVGAN